MIIRLIHTIFHDKGKGKSVTGFWQLMRVIVLIAGLSVIGGEVWGQTLSQYTFSATGGTYTEISNTTQTLSGGDTDDGYYNNLAIGFTFKYCGTNYTTISASTNGWLTFGQNITDAAYENNLTSGGTRPLVAPLWDDHLISGNFRISTTGTAPNRVFTAQWRRLRWVYNATGNVISFQVKLYETTNVISFIYDREGTAVLNPSASIGLTNSSTGSGSFWSLNGTGTNPTASSTIETANLSARPASDQVYTFTPPTSVTYYSTGNDPANALTSWWTNTNGTGSNPANFSSGDIFIVQSGDNMTVPAGGWSVTGANSQIQVASGGSLNCGTGVVSGNSFTVLAGGTLVTGNTAGITAAGATGSIQTTTRTFDVAANYIYNGGAAQATGSGLPATVNNLTINNTSGVNLTANLTVNGVLDNQQGALNITGRTVTLAGTVTRGGAGTGTITGSVTSNLTLNGTGNLGTLYFTTGGQTLNNFTVNRTATGSVTLGTALTISGTLTPTAGQINTAFDLNLNSNPSCGGGGSINATAGTVNFANTATNITPGTYYNLTKAGANTANLCGSVTVNGILNFNSCNLSLGSSNYDLTLGNSASISAAAYSNTHMIVCNGTGSVIKQSTAALGFQMIFPVGTGTYYTPFEITSLNASIAGTGSIAVRTINSLAPGPPVANASDLVRYWQVASSGLSGVTASASFIYNAGDLGIGDETIYEPALYTTAWSTPSGSVNETTNTITISTTDLNGQWTAREPVATYYSYQSGGWGTANTWTTDPSGTLSVSPSVPGVGDRVVILNGRTITTTTGYTILSIQINEGGTLDLQTSTGHDLGTVSGQGLLRLASNTFPGGTSDFTSFVSSEGGTVEYYNAASFSLNQLTYNNLILNLPNAANIATLVGNLTVNGDFKVTSGVFQINDNTTTSRIVNIFGDVNISGSGAIRLGSGNANHTFSLKGNFINYGSVDFYEGTAADYEGTIYNTTAHADVAFNNTASDQNLVCNGYSEFYRIAIDKGTDWTYTLFVTANNTTNFYLYGRNPTQGADNTNNTKALGLTSGTLSLGINIVIPCLTSDPASTNNYNINSAAQLIIDGANVSTANVASDMGIVVYGKLYINAGTFDATNTRASIITRSTGNVTITGGTFIATQLRTSNEAGTHRGAFIMTGGTLNLITNTASLSWADNSRLHATLSFSYPDNVFKMSGGTINILGSTPHINDGGGIIGFDYSIVIGANPENISITGGAINVTIPTGRPAYIASTAPFWDLNVIGTNGTNSFGLRNFVSPTGTPVSVNAQPLVVYNDFTLQNSAIFDNTTNTQNVTVGGDFTILSGTSYNPGNNITNLNGSSGQTFDNTGTIGSGGLNNFVISNSSNTTITNNLIVRNGLTVNTGCFLQDNGRTINVNVDITNSGTHISQAGGGIILNGTTDQSIGGDGNGIFGNLIINKTAGLASFSANQTLIGNLRLANGLLNIGSYNLSLGAGSNVYDALTGITAVFSGAKMIRTSGNMSDGGVTKTYNSTTAFVFPVGTVADYTPATIQFNSTPTAWGTLNVKPVAQFNPFVTSTNSLNYYWKVTQSGFTGVPVNSVSHTYRYVNSDLTGRGTETNYIPGVYNPYSWVYINDISQVVDASNDIRFNNVSYAAGDFTAGELDAFQPVKVFYSRVNGNWNDPNTWSSVAVGGAIDGALPGNNNPVVIGDGTINHTVTVPGTFNNIVIGGLQINSGSVLDITTSTGHNFGSIPDSKVSGTGKLRISSSGATAAFPGGDFGNFLTAGGGTVEYYSTGALDFTIPASKTYYNNLILSPASGRYIAMPNIDLTVFGNYTISGVDITGVARLNAATAHTLTVEGNINVAGGTLQYYNGTAQTIYANGDINISAGAAFNVRNGGTAVTNLLYISGNLNNDGAFDMYTSGTLIGNVYFIGDANKVISGVGTNDFNILNVNKGNSRNTILDVTANNLSLSYTGGTALVLSNGTFRVSNSSLVFTLSTTAAFTIPISAALSVNTGSVTIGTTDNNGDLILAGRLEVINTGVVSIGNGGNYNNDIVYASGGNPEIIVTGNGNLTVNGQIRRSVSINTGSLNYTQSDNSIVTIAGRQAVNTRGMLEVLNSGSSFSMTGGTLSILRNYNNVLYNELYLVPETNSVTGGTVRLGSSSVVDGTSFNFVSSTPLYNLIVDATTTTKSINLRISPLVVLNDLTIEGNSDFKANGLDVTIKGSLINYNGNAGAGISIGGYQVGSLTQTTTFNGLLPQFITSYGGANLTNFGNLVISPSSSVTLSSNTNIAVNKNLTLNSGTLDDGSNTINVTGNIDNNAVHSSPTVSGGIILSGTQKQIISGNGNGIFGNVTLNNSLGIDMVDNSVINGRLTFGNGNLYIDDYLLTFGLTASIGGTPDENNMILMNGVISDQGVKKLYPATAGDFTFPIGVAGKYTPARFDVTANTAAGTILIRPINYKHPSTYENPAATNELRYYWNVVSTGFSGLGVNHQYNYKESDALPDETNYVVGRYTTSTYTWLTPAEGVVNFGSDNFVLNSVNYIDGEYTCGVNIMPSPNFQDIPIYYSRNATSGGNWTDPNAWTLNPDGSGGPTLSYPQGNAAIILTGHTITINSDGQTAYATEIHGILNVGSTLYHSLGHIRGDGTIRLTSTGSGSFVLPAGEYEDFMSNSASTIDFYNNNIVTAATLPLKPGNDYKPFQNVIFSGDGVKYMSAENMRILGNLTINAGTGTLNNTLHNRNLTILGNWTDNNTAVTGGFVPGTGNVIFNGTGAQTLTITGATTVEQFYNLQVNNNHASGVSISGGGQATVSNNLYLTLGNITTTATNLLSISNTNTSAVIGGSSSSFVNGPLQKSINSGSFFNFPVGNSNGTKYGNLYVSNVTVTGNYLAQYYHHNPGADTYNPANVVAPIDAVSNVEYWRVNGSAATANVRVRWDNESAIIPADAASRSKLRIVEWNGAAWQNRGNVIVDGGVSSGTIQTSPALSVSGDHRFTIGVESLPTVDITSTNTSFCNDGVATATITVALTGTAPWTIKYRVNGANETTINNIASSPFNIVIGSTSPGISGAGSYVYTMSYISDATGATGIRDFTESVTVQVNASPTPVISGLTTLPLSTSTNYSVTDVVGNTYSWAISANGSINSGGSTYQANVQFTSGVTGWVRVIETMPNGCSVTTANYNITITDIPSPLVTGNTSVCVNGTSETYSTPDVPTHTYVWSLPLGGGSISGSGNTATVNWTSSGARSVRVSETGSSTVSYDLDVTVNSLPSNALAVSDPAVCLGQTANVIVTAGEAGSDYTLRLNSDNSVVVTVHNTSAGNVTLPVTPATTGNFMYNIYVTNEYSCSQQLTDISTVTINALPATGPVYRQPNN